MFQWNLPSRSRRLLILGLYLVALPGAGCGSGPKLMPVAGTVTLEGKPLKGGSVAFKPDIGKGNRAGVDPVGEINEQGGYRLMTRSQDGAPAGWYKVCVYYDVPLDPKDPYSPPKSLINTKYKDPNRTELSVQVVENPAPEAYDLKLSK